MSFLRRNNPSPRRATYISLAGSNSEARRSIRDKSNSLRIATAYCTADFAPFLLPRCRAVKPRPYPGNRGYRFYRYRISPLTAARYVNSSINSAPIFPPCPDENRSGTPVALCVKVIDDREKRNGVSSELTRRGDDICAGGRISISTLIFDLDVDIVYRVVGIRRDVERAAKRRI